MAASPRPAAASAAAAPHDGSTRTTFHVGVGDLQAKPDAAQAMGAKTVMPPVSAPGGPSIAMLTDADGNLIGLMKGAVVQARGQSARTGRSCTVQS